MATEEQSATSTGPESTILLTYGTNRAFFQLIDSRLHIPTVCGHFKVASVVLDGTIHPTDERGFTFTKFDAGAELTVEASTEPLCRVQIVRVVEETAPPDENGKRRMGQVEELLGVMALPTVAAQPTSLSDFHRGVVEFLQQAQSGTAVAATPQWNFTYFINNSLVSVHTDAALQDVLSHFRTLTANACSPDEALAVCRLYLTPDIPMSQPEGLPKAMDARTLRARIAGMLESAANTKVPDSASPSNAAGTPASALSGDSLAQFNLLPPEMQQNMALQHQQQQYALTLLQSQYGGLQGGSGQTPPQSPQFGGSSAAGGGGRAQSGGRSYAMPLAGQFQAQGGNSSGGEGRGGGEGKVRKESKTRLPDGRFRNEEQHQRKMADMFKKCSELFDGGIAGSFEILDHRKIKCLMCNHMAATYSPYHTDCVRKHFLRHHESVLISKGVDVTKWRKEYEAGGRQRGRAGDMMAMHHDVASMAQQQHMQQQGLPALNALGQFVNYGGAGSLSGFGSHGIEGLMAQVMAASQAGNHGGVPALPALPLTTTATGHDSNGLQAAVDAQLPAHQDINALLAALQQQAQGLDPWGNSLLQAAAAASLAGSGPAGSQAQASQAASNGASGGASLLMALNQQALMQQQSQHAEQYQQAMQLQAQMQQQQQVAQIQQLQAAHQQQSSQLALEASGSGSKGGEAAQPEAQQA